MSPVLLCPAGTDRETWLAARRAGIGASEIAAVMGISPWDSPFSLYWRKREGWEVEENDAMRTGTLVEPVVADWWASTQDAVVHPAGLYMSAERPWQLATPDRLVCDPQLHDNPFPLDPSYVHSHPDTNTLAVLECKWTGTWHGWGEPGTDDIPVYYRAQVLWQCDVMGVDEWHLAVLGPSGFRAYHGRRDERDLAVMRTLGAAFWARLEAGDPPEFDGHAATIDTLRQLHTLGDGELDLVDVAGPAAAVQLAEGYRRARALKKHAESLIDRYEARIRDQLGHDFHRLTCNGRLVASRSVYERKPYEVGPTTIDKLNPGRAASYA